MTFLYWVFFIHLLIQTQTHRFKYVCIKYYTHSNEKDKVHKSNQKLSQAKTTKPTLSVVLCFKSDSTLSSGKSSHSITLQNWKAISVHASLFWTWNLNFVELWELWWSVLSIILLEMTLTYIIRYFLVYCDSIFII